MKAKKQIERIRKRVGTGHQLTPRESAFMETSYHCPDKITNGGKIVTINASDETKEVAKGIIKKLCPTADPEQRYVNIVLEKSDLLL